MTSHSDTLTSAAAPHDHSAHAHGHARAMQHTVTVVRRLSLFTMSAGWRVGGVIAVLAVMWAGVALVVLS